MGTVFGRQSVAEPSFEVLYKHQASASIPYEIRRYGQRFAAETSYSIPPTKATPKAEPEQEEKQSETTDSSNHDSKNPDSSPFWLLGKYIGVSGTPENEGQQSISMTAPVIKQGEPMKISMTAPVIKSGAQQQNSSSSSMTMAFILPAEFDSMEKIPKPLNPLVHIKEIPPAVGAVHRYSGSFSDDLCQEKAQALAEQLRKDGLKEVTDEYALQNYQFWGFNPPFTLPMFRRNEIWLELSEDQVKQIVNGVDSKTAN